MQKLAFKLCVRNYPRFFPTLLAEFLTDNHGKSFLYNILYCFSPNLGTLEHKVVEEIFSDWKIAKKKF